MGTSISFLEPSADHGDCLLFTRACQEIRTPMLEAFQIIRVQIRVEFTSADPFLSFVKSHTYRDSDPGPMDRKSDALTTRPLAEIAVFPSSEFIIGPQSNQRVICSVPC